MRQQLGQFLLLSLSCRIGGRRRFATSTSAMAAAASDSPQIASRLVYGAGDALFGSIEARQGERPFGRVLDAGTGLHSLRWLATLTDARSSNKGLTECVAVTADANMQSNCQREVDLLAFSDTCTLVRGNWFPHADDPAATSLPALEGEMASFDTILADYLIGAMDGFSPYTQDLMIGKLCRYLKPGGRLYLVGLEPLPDAVPQDAAATIICRIRQVRDACILLAGHRCYREYPLPWIQRSIEAQPRLRVLASAKFPILYTYATVLKQINVGRSKLPIIRRSNPALADGLARELQELDTKLKQACQERPGGRIQLGFDYVVTAELEEEES